MVEYHPISTKYQSRIHLFGRKALPGFFLGYALYAGGIWKGDILVVDIEELEKMDASEIPAERLNAKEVITPQNGWSFCVHNRRKVKLSGGDQTLRTFTLIRDHPERGEERKKSSRRTRRSPPPQDSFPDAGEARNDFWSISGKCICHHVEPRVKFYVPREESFRIPLWYFDVAMATHATFDVLQESRIDDYMNIDGDWDQSDAWTFHTVHHIEWATSRRIHTVPCERLTKRQATSWPDHLWPEIWKDMSEAAQQKEKQKWAVEKTEARQYKKVEKYLTHRSERWRVQGNFSKRAEKVGKFALQDHKKRALGNLWLFWHSQDKIRMLGRSRRISEEAFGRELHIKDHEDHIAGKGFNSVSHHNLSHKLIPYASSNENTRWPKPAWQMTK